jgi:molybdopterin molybdotransferase
MRSGAYVTLVEPDWGTARTAAHASGAPLPTEAVPLHAAVGRTLAHEIRASSPLPPWGTSAMDGWAVCGEPPWVVVGDVRAGQVHRQTLTGGQAARISTGAEVPVGAVAVLRNEAGSIDPAGRLWGVVSPGAAVRPAGEEAQTGDLLLEAGRRMGPAEVGLIASAGLDEICAIRQPRVRVFVFGDELLTSGPVRDGRIRDSLGPQIPGWLALFGVDTLGVHHVSDTMDAHVAAIESADDADVVVTTGGTARGPADFVHAAILAVGMTLIVDSVACRPGHPMLLAQRQDQWLIGLPGNPLAAIAGLFTLGQPLFAALHGCSLPALGSAQLTEPLGPATSAVTRLIPCTLTDGHAAPTAHAGSGMLRGLAAADALAVVSPRGCDAGDRVPLLTLG